MNGVTQWEAKEIIREKNARIEALTAENERLMEEGARLALEAAAKEANSKWGAVLDAKDILALSPAAIVKGAGHDRD